MSYNYIVFLFNFFNVWIIKFPNLACSNHSIHSRHVYIHYNHFISFLIFCSSLLTFHYCLFSTNCLICFNLVSWFENHLKNLYIKNCVINNQNLIQISCIHWRILFFCRWLAFYRLLTIFRGFLPIFLFKLFVFDLIIINHWIFPIIMFIFMF